jgi:hypothetical protein
MVMTVAWEASGAVVLEGNGDAPVAFSSFCFNATHPLADSSATIPVPALPRAAQPKIFPTRLEHVSNGQHICVSVRLIAVTAKKHAEHINPLIAFV